jgi:UDP-perosamine 4-acetyltransferase
LTAAIVLGTGGHARSCLDVLESAGVAVRGCVGGPPVGPLQVDYLGGDDVLPRLFAEGASIAFVAVGDNAVRRTLMEQIAVLGFATPAAVSSHAFVSPTAAIKPGAFVMHGAVIGPFSVVGAGAIINTSASIDHDCSIGDFAHLAPGTHLAGTVTVDAEAFLGVGVSVTPGRRIGAGSIIGAGATVVRDIPDRTTAVGVPARPRGKRA